MLLTFLTQTKLNMETARILYIIGSSFFILVGLLHTKVHFAQLVNSSMEQKLKKATTVKLGKVESEIWKLWQGFSLGFGALMMVIGIINILSLYELDETAFPSASICIVNLLVFVFVIYSGKKFFGKMQFYGGFVGVLIFGGALLLRYL